MLTVKEVIEILEGMDPDRPMYTTFTPDLVKPVKGIGSKDLTEYGHGLVAVVY